MKLFNYYTEKREPLIGIEIDNKQYNFTQIWEFFKDIKGYHRSPQLVFLQMMIELDFFHKADIEEVLTTVKEFRNIDDIKITEHITFDVPIARPQKIICIGRNYKKHAEELGNAAPTEPIFFAKIPSAMIPHEGVVQIPQGVGRVDHEIELAIVIGKEAKYIAADKAEDVIAGYTIVNDITAREMQKKDMRRNQPWLRSKNFDTFCPIGPYIVPAKAIENPLNLDLSLKVNGEIRQSSNTSNMIFSLSDLVAYVSKHMTLLPGDIIATGTPDGVSPLKSGDHVVGEIQSIGVLENQVR